MKKLSVVVLILGLIFSLSSAGTGVGTMVGDPYGLTAKIWSGEKIGYAFALGSGLGGLYLHGDYTIHNKNLISGIPVYYGLGFHIILGGDNEHNFRLGVRVPLGVDYFFASEKFDVFLEIVPVVKIIPFGFGIGSGLGIRYNF